MLYLCIQAFDMMGSHNSSNFSTFLDFMNLCSFCLLTSWVFPFVYFLCTQDACPYDKYFRICFLSQKLLSLGYSKIERKRYRKKIRCILIFLTFFIGCHLYQDIISIRYSGRKNNTQKSLSISYNKNAKSKEMNFNTLIENQQKLA